jgi:hypothetical protein
MEGAINLGEVFPEAPDSVSIALGRYAPGTGGLLLPSTQVPGGNGNGTIESDEFMVIPVSTIRDDNFTGLLDVLEPDPGFRSLLTNEPEGFAVRWPAVPGQAYQVLSSAALAQPMLPLTDQILAGEGVFSLSYTDSAFPPQRFYRIHNVTQP